MTSQSNTEYETYYVPEKSRLALCATIGLVTMLFGGASVLNDQTFGDPEVATNSWFIFLAGSAFFAATLFGWFSLTIKENRAGMNSRQLKYSYAIGMQWFIFSEVMFFAAFFGALFYVRNLAGPWLGGQGEGGVGIAAIQLWGDFQFSWPLMETPQEAVGGAAAQAIANNGTFVGPEKNMAFPGWGNLGGWLPLWNTIILITSSFTVHIAHLGLKQNNRAKLNLWLAISVILAVIFLYLQYVEYHEAYAEYGLKLTSGTYGTTFFLLTGFHGFHVCMGMFMLFVQWLRVNNGHFTPEDHFGFEASSWYWHFVDVVWVGLFIFVYIL
jgi:cytochrome c oxidase subunit 3